MGREPGPGALSTGVGEFWEGPEEEGGCPSLREQGTRWLEPGVHEASALELGREGPVHLPEALESCPARPVLGTGRGHPTPQPGDEGEICVL